MTRISVVIPIYNVEKYLNRCIDSVLHQTFTDFECILVDDGSPDNCGKICDEYAKKDKRIKVIHKENGGLSDARNAGIEILEGEYIFFVDSDDWLHPQAFEIMYMVAKSTSADMVSIGYIKTKSYETEYKNYDIQKEVNEFEFYEKQYILNNLYGKIQRDVGVEACKKLYKKQLFDNIRFRKGIIHEDDDVFLDLVLSIKSVAISQIPLYFYYMSPGSIMRSGFSEKEFVRLEIDIRNIKRINKENIITQKKLCSIPYLQHYMEFSYLIADQISELSVGFEKYRKDYAKNILYMIKNKNLSKAFVFLAVLFYISPKMAKKYYCKWI